MPNSPSLLAYPDVQKAMDEALAAPAGVRLVFKGGAPARNKFLFRSLTFRRLDRENNKILYPDPAMTMHGKSIYDTLVVKKLNESELLIMKITSDEFDLEVL